MLCILATWVLSGFGDAHWLYTNHVVSTGFIVDAGSISAGSTDWSSLGRGRGYLFSAGFEPYDAPDKPPPNPEDPFGAPLRPQPALSEIFTGTLKVHRNGSHFFITVPFWLFACIGALLVGIWGAPNKAAMDKPDPVAR